MGSIGGGGPGLQRIFSICNAIPSGKRNRSQGPWGDSESYGWVVSFRRRRSGGNERWCCRVGERGCCCGSGVGEWSEGGEDPREQGHPLGGLEDVDLGARGADDRARRAGPAGAFGVSAGAGPQPQLGLVLEDGLLGAEPGVGVGSGDGGVEGAEGAVGVGPALLHPVFKNVGVQAGGLGGDVGEGASTDVGADTSADGQGRRDRGRAVGRQASGGVGAHGWIVGGWWSWEEL